MCGLLVPAALHRAIASVHVIVACAGYLLINAVNKITVTIVLDIIITKLSSLRNTTSFYPNQTLA